VRCRVRQCMLITATNDRVATRARDELDVRSRENEMNVADRLRRTHLRYNAHSAPYLSDPE
jgi:hypothetical protein